LEKINKIKEKAIKKVTFSTEQICLYSSCFKCCCMNKDKKYLVQKAIKLVEKNIEVSEIIKKNFEMEFLKRLLLNEHEYNLFPYQFKNINLKNVIDSKNYLNNLQFAGFKRLEENHKKEEQEK